MLELNDKQIAEYLKRSFSTVDGLWFMKVEEKYGFDTALEIDNEVWKIIPKFQARLLKSMGNLGNGIEALLECFTTKLTLDGFTFTTERMENPDGFRIISRRCPWHDLMVKSGRKNLSEKVGNVICNTEFSGWAAEFDDNIRFELLSQICKGSEHCVLQFSH